MADTDESSLDRILDLQHYGQVLKQPESAAGSVIVSVQLELVEASEIAGFIGGAVLMEASSSGVEAVIETILAQARAAYPGLNVRNYSTIIILSK